MAKPYQTKQMLQATHFVKLKHTLQKLDVEFKWKFVHYYTQCVVSFTCVTTPKFFSELRNKKPINNKAAT